jgi:hypothetical protein
MNVVPSSQRLTRKPFGTRGNVIGMPFRFGCSERRFLKARCANSVVPARVVPGVIRRLVMLIARCAGRGSKARSAQRDSDERPWCRT